MHQKIDAEIAQLEQAKQAYLDKIKKAQSQIDSFNNVRFLERYARQHYYMKRKGETIYILKDKNNAEPKSD